MNNFVEIPLFNSAGILRGVTLVSPEDESRCRARSWFYNAQYAYSYFREHRKKINMGRFILGLAPDSPLEPDHINNNTLDNRRENLRAVTHHENTKNMLMKNALIHGLPVCGVGNNKNLAVAMSKREHEFLLALSEQKNIKLGYFVRKTIFKMLLDEGFDPQDGLNGKRADLIL